MFSTKERVRKGVDEYIKKNGKSPTHLMVSATYIAEITTDLAEDEGWSVEDEVTKEVVSYEGLKVGVSFDINFPDFVILS